MSSFPSRIAAIVWAAAAVLLTGNALAQTPYFSGIGRPATDKELQAWDIDVRPDFLGLPKGSGSVAQGQVVWEAQCASCHGIFGESNEVFSPLVGGTTAKDVLTGRVARLTDASFPGRPTLMKLATVSTLWDYISRAMPWNAPKTLKPDEVYAVTAFLLNLGGVLPDNFTLSDSNIAAVQARMPNRLGMSTQHGLWPGRGLGHGKPDVNAAACMKNCATEPQVRSFLPDFARNAHGNLAEQNRAVGAQVGADTTRPAGSAGGGQRPAVAKPVAKPVAAADPNAVALTLARKHNCLTCHGLDNKVVGPGLREIARRHAARPEALAYLAQKIVAGGSGAWGAIPMPAQSLPADDAMTLARWLTAGAK